MLFDLQSIDYHFSALVSQFDLDVSGGHPDGPVALEVPLPVGLAHHRAAPEVAGVVDLILRKSDEGGQT